MEKIVKYYYVYILESVKFENHSYIGFAADLKKRLKTHNEGGSKQTAISFSDKKKTTNFEKYLKLYS